jgi:HD-GYP domain-containing protein (c-di-GMP phosphodiesterase class II)
MNRILTTDHLLGKQINQPAPNVLGGNSPNAWDCIERCAREIQINSSAQDQLRVVIRAIHDATGADIVYWYPGIASDEPICFGRRDVSSDWCRQTTIRVLEESSSYESEFIWKRSVNSTLKIEPVPQSIAMVRLSQSRASWIVAINLSSDEEFVSDHVKIMTLARQLLLNNRHSVQSYSRLKETLTGVIQCLSMALDAKDPSSWGHSERVARMAICLGEHLSLTESALNDLYLAGLLHDIGKINVPESILQKAGPLNDQEWSLMRNHPILGDRLLSNIKPLAHLSPVVRSHHERFDGKGYPDGLRGDEIPFFGRILAIVESLDSMMTTLPYRAALSPLRVENILKEGSGSQWDPHLIQVCLNCIDELRVICWKGQGGFLAKAIEAALVPSSAGRSGNPSDQDPISPTCFG